MISDHHISELLLHALLREVTFADSSEYMFLLSYFKVEINPTLIRLDCADGGVGRIGRILKRRVVVLRIRWTLANLIACVCFEELTGTGWSQPEILTNVWVQIAVLTVVRHDVEHAEEDELALRLCERALRIDIALSVAFPPAKFMDFLFRAAVGALWVHRYNFQQSLDTQPAALQELLELAWRPELISTGGLIILRRLLLFQPAHLVHFASRFVHSVWNGVHLVCHTFLDDFHISLIFFVQLVEPLVEYLIEIIPLSSSHSELLWENLCELDLVQVLVRVCLHLRFQLLLDLLHRELIDTIGWRYTELSEVATSLLCALVRVRVLDPQAEHRRLRFFRMEYTLDLSLKLEKVVLSEINLFQLQFDRLFYDSFQVLYDFFIPFWV